jgi:hypothetical protein
LSESNEKTERIGNDGGSLGAHHREHRDVLQAQHGSQSIAGPHLVGDLRKTSKFAVYRQRKAYNERLGDLSETEMRWRHRHLPRT